ncbi:unnamed protein product, partial [Tetraodon nigroviridis]
GGRIHHHCITFLSSRPWCSLTHNFDRDRQFGFCAPNPARAGGRCYETSHLRYFDAGESWGRIHYGTWSSARVRPGKSRAKKSATQVRLGALPTWTGWRVKFRLNAGFRSLQIAIGLRRDRVSSPGSVL